MKVEERLLKYVSIWTTSDGNNPAFPSSERQLDLARELKKEMEEMGIQKVALSEDGYVYGMLPATPGMENKKAIGLIAHMDTAPDYSGENVKPQIIPDYNGEDVVLPATGAILSVKDFPHLPSLKGRTLITTDGTTLLGADDKAGIAAILTAAEQVITSGQPHGELWFGFTPDEEVGKGADRFDLNYFEADYGYTVDGGYEGEIAYENFNAASALFEITGKNVHPGSAKDVMINAVLIGTEIAQMLPADETPATTEGREGFYHLVHMEGNIASAKLAYIIRDHDKTSFAMRLANLERIAAEMNAKYGESRIKLTIRHSYENMLSVIENHMYIIERAEAAIREAGLTLETNPVRGGTDGARLSFMGLPCPNLGTGGYAYHGPFEHITVEGMEGAVRVLSNIINNPVDR